MGNKIQHQFYPLSPQNPSTRSQSQNHSNSSESINRSYNPKKQSLLQLTISDTLQLQAIMTNLQLYSSQNGISPSISTLKEYYKVKKEGYCTNQYVLYLVFDGCGCCGLKDQFGVRKIMGRKFNDEEIIKILKTYLTGVLIYLKDFKRNIQKIDLDDIGFELIQIGQQEAIDNKNQLIQTFVRMYFIDPWLKERKQQEIISVNEVNIMLQNPSPQRLQKSFNLYSQFNNNDLSNDHSYQSNHGHSSQGRKSSSDNSSESYKKRLQCLLFSIGVIGLKLLQMSFVDDIYIRMPSKKVNLQRIQQYLEKHLTQNQKNNPTNNNNEFQTNINSNNNSYAKYQNKTILRQKLISGLKILLLSDSPKQREKIYEFWNVDLNQINQLNDISMDNCDHIKADYDDKNVSANGIYQDETNYVNANSREGNGISHVARLQPIVNTNNQFTNIINAQSIGQQQTIPLKPKLYGTEQVSNPKFNLQNNNIYHSPNNSNELNSYGRQYIYRVDQLKNNANQPEPMINHHNNENIQQKKSLLNYNQQPIFLGQNQDPSFNRHQYYQNNMNTKPFQTQNLFIPNPNQLTVPSSQLSQNTYFNRIQFKLPQKNH